MKILLLAVVLLGITFSFSDGKPRDADPNGLPQVQEELGDDDDDSSDEVEVTETSKTTNPCNIKKCKRGEVCHLSDDLKANCACVKNCVPEPNPRYMVCSKHNITFDSECHLDREACWCRNGDKQCDAEFLKKLRIDYYGECKEITPCTDIEMDQFPLRIRNWMMVIMNELARRHEIDNEYLDMLEKAKVDDHHTDAVIWKFCDLDSRPKDRFVTRRELQFVTASVKPMEHCLVPFLEKCDENRDRKISLTEWGTCLKLEKDEIQDRCTTIQNKRKDKRQK